MIHRHHQRGISVWTILALCGIGAMVYMANRQRNLDAAEGKKPKLVEVPAGPVKMIIYTTKDCEPCERAKTWARAKGVDFEERNADLSPTHQEELAKLKSQIVPVILINGEPLYGFMSAHADDALAEARKPRKVMQ